MASSSQSVLASSSSRYDVFLSFRGEDVRKTFVDHLYAALLQVGIHTYKDDRTLPRGDSIGPSLLKAIKESKISVIIFSENYADSSWCLDELVHIMKCRADKGQIVYPLFYHVDPSEVRNQTGKFGEAYKKVGHSGKAESWRKALSDAGKIAGWEPEKMANGHESEAIKEIVNIISDQLFSLMPHADEDLVGMGTRLHSLKSKLEIGSGGVRMVGIWGMGGSGKTTLASSLYAEISGQFDGHCIIDNVRDESGKCGLKGLQEKVLLQVLKRNVGVYSVDDGRRKIKNRLCGRKVLILLDDVNNGKQLEALAGSHKWFGDGSRIIITTRDEHLLNTHKVDVVAPISLLSQDEAIRLFNRHAYDEDRPVEDYVTLSLRVISYATGLPLALKVLGSFLYDKDKKEWMSTLARLEVIPESEIVEMLKISYDGLGTLEKELFLDIACFHRGMYKIPGMEMLNACGFNPDIGIKVLMQKALITISEDGRFDMHDLVQEMGHYIVRGEHPHNPEKHDRVWKIEEIDNMCLGDATTANDKIEALKYSGWSSRFPELLSIIKTLRSLFVSRIPFDSEGEDILLEAPTFLSNELRCIQLLGYVSFPLPESFQSTKLVHLRISRGLQKELWMGYKLLPRLKELYMDDMKNLLSTPDFNGLPCLEKLRLNFCPKLEEIHPSLGYHSGLVNVSIRLCEKLRKFPTIDRMEKLRDLEISDCDELGEFPEIKANMDSLVKLSLSSVGIQVLPSSIGEYCTSLIYIKVIECCELKSIEGNFHALKHLCNFLLTYGTKLEKLPKDLFGTNCCLQELYLPGNKFSRLDRCSLSQLTQLKLLNLTKCKNLVELPELPSNLVTLIAKNCDSLEVVGGGFHTNCKRLSRVSLIDVRSVIGGNLLLQTMLQGESHSLSLLLDGLEIPKMLTPPLVVGRRRRLQLPHNWYNDFSGFLMCAALRNGDLYSFSPNITMKKHEMGGSLSIIDSRFKEKEVCAELTWVGYVSFASLRNTAWWDQTSTQVSFSIEAGYESEAFGVTLISKKSPIETTNFNYDYHQSHFEIRRDSKDDLEITF